MTTNRWRSMRAKASIPKKKARKIKKGYEFGSNLKPHTLNTTKVCTQYFYHIHESP